MNMNLSVVFYIPNIIDYLRIALLMTSIFLKGGPFAAAYGLSVSLDYFDGLLARKLQQVSVLGGALDMIIDRISTAIILFKTAVEKPKYASWCIAYVTIDFVSHFIFFLVAAYTGMHHKKFSDNIFLSLYYQKSFLYLMCLGSELCFITLYLMSSKGPNSRWMEIFVGLLQSIAAVKTFFHVVHFVVGVLVMSTISDHRPDVKVD